MSAFILLTITGLGLGALYFLIAAGLSLIYGLMGVLNFAHGAFFTVGAYATWWAMAHMTAVASLELRLALAILCGLAVGTLVATLVELVLIRPLYRRHIEQVLATLGFALALTALAQGVFGADALPFPAPSWVSAATTVLGVSVPNSRFVVIVAAIIVLALLVSFLRFTRYGLIIRAGVENRAMVTALGIDVQRSFTLVFALGGLAAALGGALGDLYFGSVDPGHGTALLIFAFIVVVIGGLGSIVGSAVAAVIVGLFQQYLNYYASAEAGDVAVILLLAAVLLIRPQGLFGRIA